MQSLYAIGFVVIGYALGSIPFAVIIARRHGIDIFQSGSGNPGATNVKRVLGQKAGNLCFALDCVKGLAAAWLPQGLFAGEPGPGLGLGLGILGLVGAILGHSYSCFIGFKGGKGVAVTMGGLLALNPGVLLIGIGVWSVAFYASRYVSLASILFGVSLPISAFLFNSPSVLTAFLALLAGLIIVRHKANIQRLINGTENKFSKP